MKKTKPLSMPELVKRINKNKAIKAKITQKKIKIAKIVLISLGSLILISLLFTAFKKISKFLNENKFVTYQIVKIQFHKPFEFVSNEDYQKQKEMEKRLEDLIPYFQYRMENPDPIFELDDPTRTPEEALQEFSQIFFETIHVNESSKGKNTSDPTALHLYCRNLGKWNEIGYNPQNKYCFNSKQEAQNFVARYIQRNCNGKTLNECLCYWNTGTASESCHYSNNNLSLAN